MKRSPLGESDKDVICEDLHLFQMLRNLFDHFIHHDHRAHLSALPHLVH